MMILQCWVIPAKDISSACNWFVHIYKNLLGNWSNDARALHWVQPEPFSLTMGLVDWAGYFRIVLERMRGSSCLGAGGELSTKVTGTFLHWWGRSWLWFCVSPVCTECLKQVCTFDMILHFQSHQSILWILRCVWLNRSNSSNTFSPFCLQGNIPISVLGYFGRHNE